MELIDNAPDDAFAGQDAVLRFQIGIGHGFQLIEILDGRNVRILFLDFQKHLSAIDGLFFERGNKRHCKHEEENN